MAALVEVDAADLAAPASRAAQEAVARAFGPAGLGAIAVRGVEGYAAAREDLLPLARAFAALDARARRRFEVPERHYQFGWSHGKETLEDGSPDLRKGSFYANPFPAADPAGEADADRNLSSRHNVWPSQEIPGLQPAMERLSEIMRATANLVAQACDVHLASRGVHTTHQPLARVTVRPTAAKGRLLYYYPSAEAPDAAAAAAAASSSANWCGWHRDHGSITCLTKAMYFDEGASGTGAAAQVRPQQDDLRIRTRAGDEVVAEIPEDCIAFQIGQAAQIESGCWLGATPHCVALTREPQLSRCTYALFLQPSAADVLLAPSPRAPDVAMPPQYAPGMTFAEFTAATLDMIYRDAAAGGKAPSKI